MSGAALYRPLWFFTGVGLIAAYAYVIVLELVISWGLLAERAWVFWTTFAQIALFHVMSWAIAHFIYPLLMFALVAICPLARLVPRPGARVGLLGPLMRGTVGWGSCAMAAIFSILQLVPHADPGDPAVTGEGRLCALHMFDAKVECEAYADVRAADGAARRLNLRRLHLRARRTTDPILHEVIDVPRFYARRLRYDPIRHNPWIRTA